MMFVQHMDVVIQVRDMNGDLHLASTGITTPPVPYQLPAVSRHFIDRELQLDQLARLHDGILEERRDALAMLCGPGGVEKTILASHFLHSEAAVFADGQLYADLS